MVVRTGLFLYGWEERNRTYGFISLGWVSPSIPIEIGIYESIPFKDPVGCIWSKEILNGYIGDAWGFYESDRETKNDINTDYSFLRNNGYNVGMSILGLFYIYTNEEIKEDLELNPL